MQYYEIHYLLQSIQKVHAHTDWLIILIIRFTEHDSALHGSAVKIMTGAPLKIHLHYL